MGENRHGGFESVPEVRVLPSAGVTQPRQYYDPVRRPPGPSSRRCRRRDLRPNRASTDYPHHLSNVPCPLPRRIERVHVSIASPSTRPSPLFRRVGIRIITFEACSGFTHVTARWIAQPPKAAFVTRLPPGRLPNQAARQLPEQSTTLRVKSSSTGGARLRRALNKMGYAPSDPGSRPPNSSSQPRYASGFLNFSWIPRKTTSSRNSSPNEPIPIKCRASNSQLERKFWANPRLSRHKEALR